MLNYKILLITAILAVTINQISCSTLCRTSEEKANDESSDVKQFFKSAGCKLEKGAQKVAEGAKSLGHTVKEGAKKFGGNVKEKYHELKDKITGDQPTTEITEGVDIRNVPLAPFDSNANKCPDGQRLDAKGICHPI